MREIKFRVWDNESKRFGSPNVHYISKQNDICCIETDMSILKISGPDRFSIQQYIGLKDGNGEEIYEGDIVKHLDTEELCQIIFEDESASYITLTVDEYGETGYDVNNVVEVIGNIFQNPELLK